MKKARLDYTFISPLNCKACKIKTIQLQEASKKQLQYRVLPDKTLLNRKILEASTLNKFNQWAAPFTYEQPYL